MTVLLDTHCWLWWISYPFRLNDEARRIITNRQNIVYFSVASTWEIAIKYAVKKLRFPEIPEEFMPRRLSRDGIIPLPISLQHALRVASLPHHHRDPFDRLLVAQARVEGIPLLTADARLSAYEVQIIRAD